MQIKEFRQKNPTYDDMSNSQLGYALWNRHYKDDMNAWRFAEEFGLNAEEVSEMRQSGLDDGLSEVDIAGDFAKADKGLGQVTSTMHGQTLALGPELGSIMLSTEEKLQNPDQSWGELYSKNKGMLRSNLEAYRNEYPIDALKTEIAGAVLSPVGALRLPGILSHLPTGMQAMLKGFVGGTIYGVNEAQDNKLASGLETGVLSAVFTGGTDKLLRSFKPASATVKSLMRLRKNPTVENLKIARTAAYKEVDATDLRFDVSDIKSIWKAGDTAILDRVAYDPMIDKTVKSIEKQFRSYINKGKLFKLSELDNLRKNLFKRQTNANPNEKQIIGKMIDQIDNVIDTKPTQGKVMRLARNLHGKYMKTKQLDDAFNVARRAADASGSGGNMFNLYKQAVKNILNSEKKNKFFKDWELEAMEHFVSGKTGEKAMRIISKASPSGNGLIFFLTATAATMNPAVLGLTAAGWGAKRGLEKGIKKQAGKLIESIGKGPPNPNMLPPGALPGIPTLMSVTTGSPAALDNPLEGLMNTIRE